MIASDIATSTVRYDVRFSSQSLVDGCPYGCVPGYCTISTEHCPKQQGLRAWILVMLKQSIDDVGVIRDAGYIAGKHQT